VFNLDVQSCDIKQNFHSIICCSLADFLFHNLVLPPWTRRFCMFNFNCIFIYARAAFYGDTYQCHTRLL